MVLYGYAIANQEYYLISQTDVYSLKLRILKLSLTSHRSSSNREIKQRFTFAKRDLREAYFAALSYRQKILV